MIRLANFIEMSCLAGVVCAPLADGEDADTYTALAQITCTYPSIATIVARAGNDGGAADSGIQPQYQLGGHTTGALHQR